MFSKIQHGFDLTDFGSSEKAKRLLRENKLPQRFRRVGKRLSPGIVSYSYQTKNKNVKFIVGNNPITGMYSQPNLRKRERGYASYIGIEGKANSVKKLVHGVKKYASFIKDESKGRRDFI